MSNINRIEAFWENVPRPFLERVLRSLFDNYLLADDKCQEFEKPERSNLRPIMRRELIERSLRSIATQFPEHVTAKAVRHEDKGFWYHTRVICNDAVALTQNTVPYPDMVVRSSTFRNRYSAPKNQLFMFPDLAPEDLPSDSLLYGIIVHGRSEDSVLFPGFAQVRFPKPKLVGYYPAKIDLFEEFPEVVEEKTTGLPGNAAEEPEVEPELLDDHEFDDDFGGEAVGG